MTALPLTTASTSMAQCSAGPTMTTNGTFAFIVNGTQCTASVVTTTKKRHLGCMIAGGVVGVIVLLGLFYYLYHCKIRARSSNIFLTLQRGQGSNMRELNLSEGDPELMMNEKAEQTEKGAKMAAGGIDDSDMPKIQLPREQLFPTGYDHTCDACDAPKRKSADPTISDAPREVNPPTEYGILERPFEHDDPRKELGQVLEDQSFADRMTNAEAPHADHETLNNIEQVPEDREYVGETTEADKLDVDYGTVIGIDLGTSYSRVGVLRAGKVEIIANDRGHIPSWTSFGNDERLVGHSAKSAFYSNFQNTIFNAKRLIGRRMSDQDAMKDMKYWPFKVEDQKGKPTFVVSDMGKERYLTAEEITAMILRKLKEIAEDHLGHNVTHAVVTVPACFNDAQRQATKDAGTIAGLQVLRLVNDPTATAIAYGLNKKAAKSQIIVYDLGGGCFDASLLSIDNGEVRVLATAGFSRLGGEDFDNRVVDKLVAVYKKRTGVDVTKNLLALAKLKLDVERAKRTLSSRQEAQIEITDFEGGNDFSEMLTRAQFEELNMDLFRKTLGPVEQILNDAKVKKEAIDEVILVGGSTGIPKIQQLLKEYFDGFPETARWPTEVTVGGSKGSSKVKPLYFEEGNNFSGTFPAIKDDVSHARKPIQKVTTSLTESFSDKEPLKGINSIEAVVYGAAIHGSTLSSSQRPVDVILRVRDVCALSLGIETIGGVFAKIIPRNTVIPTRKSEVFTTVVDYQTRVSILVFEGERPLVKDNNLLDQFVLPGIRVALRGVPQIKVTFAIDASGILEVTAVDTDTRSRQSITITNEKRRLSPKEIDRMVAEAQRFEAEDKAQHRCIEAHNARRS